ncbi:3'(2'),5'-bisphosphate nucleotidase CysQ [Glutamicibacter protophormiae]|uniref:3'(2'),5'-bisphosphate nucleotidase CysQ n=1 Tax=Glutamicibacter protophormiae TaxID=37930 RepID=UPI003319400A
MKEVYFAADLAEQAGKLLLELRADASSRELTGSALKDAGDQASQEFLNRCLVEHYPEDSILSEEATDNLARLHAKRVWIIDPLDGTREYSEGRDDWAVHVALWKSGKLVVGAVALPGLGQVLNSLPEPIQALERGSRPVRIAVSRSRPPEIVTELAKHLEVEFVPMGSAGYKACAVARDEVDAYIHTGGQYEWDSAAPVAVAMSKDLHASRIDGSPLIYNQRNPYLPDLLICRKELRDVLLGALTEITLQTT